MRQVAPGGRVAVHTLQHLAHMETRMAKRKGLAVPYTVTFGEYLGQEYFFDVF